VKLNGKDKTGEYREEMKENVNTRFPRVISIESNLHSQKATDWKYLPQTQL